MTPETPREAGRVTDDEVARLDFRKGVLPPGPYEVRWPAEQGGAFTLWGRQGTPPDFKDGWAIPLVASGVDTAMYALRDMLNAPETPREAGRQETALEGLRWLSDEATKLWWQPDQPSLNEPMKSAQIEVRAIVDAAIAALADADRAERGLPLDVERLCARAGTEVDCDPACAELCVVPSERGLPLDVDTLGFHDLLDVAEAILTHYPPDSIVCSHSIKADIGAQTVAGIADVVASCRASLAGPGSGLCDVSLANGWTCTRLPNHEGVHQ